MGNQTDILPTTYPSFPWSQGDLLDAVPLNNQFISQQNQIDSLNNRVTDPSAGVAFSMTINWGGNTSPSEGPYMLMAEAPYQFTITGVDYSVGTSAGSFTAQFLNNGAAIDGLDNINVVNFGKTQSVALGTNNVIEAGNSLSMNISNIVGIPLNSWLVVIGNTQPVPQEIGVGLATAAGLSNAVAISTSAVVGSAFGTANGVATVTGVGVGSTSADAHGFGINSQANMVGVQVSFGNITGSATGTSTATGVGNAQTNSSHVLVLDDPAVGILNVNPLG